MLQLHSCIVSCCGHSHSHTWFSQNALNMMTLDYAKQCLIDMMCLKLNAVAQACQHHNTNSQRGDTMLLCDYVRNCSIGWVRCNAKPEQSKQGGVATTANIERVQTHNVKATVQCCSWYAIDAWMQWMQPTLRAVMWTSITHATDPHAWKQQLRVQRSVTMDMLRFRMII